MIKLNNHLFLKLLISYIKRIVLNTGPHGRHCKCNKWGVYVGMGCSRPACKLKNISID